MLTKTTPRLDWRYGHDHDHPARGAVVAELPAGALGVAYGGGRWYFHGGVWFRPVGARFFVGVPPVGIVVPVLPPAYATLWLGSVPYYYANDVYYTAAPGGYAVVAPPASAPTTSPVPTPPPPAPVTTAPDPVVYPRNGQPPAQAQSDRQECSRWAMAQPGAGSDASILQRATAACLDGRGYTVR